MVEHGQELLFTLAKASNACPQYPVPTSQAPPLKHSTASQALPELVNKLSKCESRENTQIPNVITGAAGSNTEEGISGLQLSGSVMSRRPVSLVV